MIKNFFEKLKHLIASIFKDAPSLLAFEAVIAAILYIILFFCSEKDKISYLSLAFAFGSFAFTLNDSNKASKETKELNKSIQTLNNLLQGNKVTNPIELQELACKEDFDNKTKLRDKTKIILFIIFFIFIIPFIVNHVTSTPSPFGFINDSNRDAWISFFGSIIGGGATLTGVYITIKKQEEQRAEDFKIQEKRRKEDFDNQEMQRRKELGIQYRPFLAMDLEKEPYDIPYEEFQSDPVIFGGIHCVELGEQRPTHFKIVLINLKNEGEGECYIKCNNKKLIDINKVNGQEMMLKNNKELEILTLSKNWHNVIPKNKSIILKICFAYNKHEKNNGEFYISYNLISTDRFNYVYYKNDLLMKFKVTYNNKNNEMDIQNVSKGITNEIIEKNSKED